MADGRRAHIAKEVLSSERTFVKQLRAIVEVYVHPLHHLVEEDKPVIKTKYIEAIFSNVEEILQVNSKLLSLLEQRMEVWNENPRVGDVFLEVLPDFDKYDKYLMDHHRAIVTVTGLEQRSAWTAFLQSAKEKPESENLDLMQLLITPVQRVLRYKLLLEDMIKSTDKSSSDYYDLIQAVEKILEKAAAVNEGIKRAANYDKLCQIQKSFITGNVKNLVTEHRMFVREGQLTKICRKQPKRRWFFLFSDILIYASAVAQPGDKSVYSFHRMISLSKLRAKALEDTEDQKYAFQIMSSDKSFTVLADNNDEKEWWLMDLNEMTTGTRLLEKEQAAKLASNIESAPVWVPDRHADMCMICKSAFTFINRRHHCRNCGKVVCGPCSSEKVQLSHLQDQKPVRVCDTCFQPDKPLASSPPSAGGMEVGEQQQQKKKPPALASEGSMSNLFKTQPNKKELIASVSSHNLLANSVGNTSLNPNILARMKIPLPPPPRNEQPSPATSPISSPTPIHNMPSFEYTPFPNMGSSQPVSPPPFQSLSSTSAITTSPHANHAAKYSSKSTIALPTYNNNSSKPPAPPVPASSSTSGSPRATHAASPNAGANGSISVRASTQLFNAQVAQKQKDQRGSMRVKPVLPQKPHSAPQSPHQPPENLSAIMSDLYEDDKPPPIPNRASKVLKGSMDLADMAAAAGNRNSTVMWPQLDPAEQLEKYNRERGARVQLEHEVRNLARLLYKAAHYESATVIELENMPVIECVRVLSKRLEEEILADLIQRNNLASSGGANCSSDSELSMSSLLAKNKKKKGFLKNSSASVILPPSRPPPTAPPSSSSP